MAQLGLLDKDDCCRSSDAKNRSEADERPPPADAKLDEDESQVSRKQLCQVVAGTEHSTPIPAKEHIAMSSWLLRSTLHEKHWLCEGSYGGLRASATTPGAHKWSLPLDYPDNIAPLVRVNMRHRLSSMLVNCGRSIVKQVETPLELPLI